MPQEKITDKITRRVLAGKKSTMVWWNIKAQALDAAVKNYLWKANPCAQCGEPLIAAKWSEHLSECRIRHIWQCDICGYEFETTVYLRTEKAADLSAVA